MSGRKSGLLVVNERSGAGNKSLTRAIGLLEEHGHSITSLLPDHPDKIAKAIRDKGPEHDVIILGGGDGTISGAAQALLDVGRPIGILPMGTANDLARTLEIPPDLEQAAEIIAGGHRRRIDLGVVDGRPFFNVASIGLGVEVARHHRGERKRRLKLLSYPISLLDAFLAHRPFTAWITCDGKSRKIRCSQIAVGNGRHYGGGMTIAEAAEIDDGWLRLYYVRAIALWRFLALLPALRFGWLGGSEGAEVLRGKNIEIRTKRPKPLNVDGELGGETPVSFGILPSALEVFVPQVRSDQGRDATTHRP